MNDLFASAPQVKCFEEIEDFEESIRNGDFKIVFMYDENCPEKPPEGDGDNRKRPIGGPKGYQDLQAVYKNDFNMRRNIGICPIRKENDRFLCVIDIDGETTHANSVKDKQQLKLGTRLFLFEILKNGFEARNISPMYVSTANDGFHIYLYITQAGDQKHPISNLIYPQKNLKAFRESQAYQQYPVLQNIGSKTMAPSAMEFFTKAGGYVVGPGSVIDGKKYSVLDSGAQRFKDISTYMDGNIEELITEILEEAGFSINYDNQVKLIERKAEIDNSKHDISPRNVAAIGKFIIDSWPLIDGEKQMASVALGGFLSFMGVSRQSIIDIGNYVIDNKPNSNFFKMSDDAERTQGFIPSLLHDADSNEDKKKQGLNSLKERFEGKIDVLKMSRILWINCNPKTHKFYPNQRYSVTYPEIVLDFHNKQIRLNNIKEGKEGTICQSNVIIHHILDEFSYIDDISTPTSLDDSLKPIQFYLKNNNGLERKYIFQDRNNWFDNYYTMYGAYTSKNSKIPGYILMEYEDLGLVDTIESSSRPGIYLSKDQTHFRKFIDSEEGIIELNDDAPNRDELTDALILLKQIRDAFPWQGDKFAAVIKISLITPYGFSYKKFRRWIPGILLIGESGTLKSTMGELICHLHTPLNVNRTHYIMNGSEFSSEYRMGRDMSRHSYPIVVNECINVFKQPGNLEFIKDAIMEEFGRNPGQGPNGEEGQVYYTRCVPLFTLNDYVEGMDEREFVRRFLTIDLSKNDLYTEEQIEENLGFLNQNGIVNGRFDELRVIGDFVFYYLNQNMDIFAQPIYSTMDSVIKGMEEYTGYNLSWLNVDIHKYIDMNIDESAQNELEYALDVIRKPFLRVKSRTFNGLSDENILEGMMGKEYSYILRTKTGVAITRGFEEEYKKRDANFNRSMKVEVLGELISSHFEDAGDCSYKQIRVQDYIKERVYGIHIPWNVFLIMVGASQNKDIEEELK